MNTSEIVNWVNTFDMSILSILFKLGLIYFIVVTLKTLIENILNYLLFRLDPKIAIGINVKVNDFQGYISKVTIHQIVIENETHIYVIRMSIWRRQSWIFKKPITEDSEE